MLKTSSRSRPVIAVLIALLASTACTPARYAAFIGGTTMMGAAGGYAFSSADTRTHDVGMGTLYGAGAALALLGGALLGGVLGDAAGKAIAKDTDRMLSKDQD
jgi:hypothetical protein